MAGRRYGNHRTRRGLGPHFHTWPIIPCCATGLLTSLIEPCMVNERVVFIGSPGFRDPGRVGRSLAVQTSVVYPSVGGRQAELAAWSVELVPRRHSVDDLRPRGTTQRAQANSMQEAHTLRFLTLARRSAAGRTTRSCPAERASQKEKNPRGAARGLWAGIDNRLGYCTSRTWGLVMISSKMSVRRRSYSAGLPLPRGLSPSSLAVAPVRANRSMKS